MTLGTFAAHPVDAARRPLCRERSPISPASRAPTGRWRSSSRAMMFSLAGIPPLAGFFAKLYVFAAAIQAGLYRARGHRRAAAAWSAPSIICASSRSCISTSRPTRSTRPALGARVVLALSTALIIFYVFAPGAAHRRRDGRGQVAVLRRSRRIGEATRAFCVGWRVERFDASARPMTKRAARALAGDPGRLWIVARRTERAGAGAGASGPRRRAISTPARLLIDPCAACASPRRLGFVAGVALRRALSRISARRRSPRSNGRTISSRAAPSSPAFCVEGVDARQGASPASSASASIARARPTGLAYPADRPRQTLGRASRARTSCSRACRRVSSEPWPLWAGGAGFAAIRAAMARLRRRARRAASASPTRAERVEGDFRGARRHGRLLLRGASGDRNDRGRRPLDLAGIGCSPVTIESAPLAREGHDLNERRQTNWSSRRSAASARSA